MAAVSSSPSFGIAPLLSTLTWFVPYPAAWELQISTNTTDWTVEYPLGATEPDTNGVAFSHYGPVYVTLVRTNQADIPTNMFLRLRMIEP